MTTNKLRLAAALIASITIGSVPVALAQGGARLSTGEATTTTTTTTSTGTIADYTPGSEVVVTSRANPRPARYSVTKETVFVDEAGTPIPPARIERGVPTTVHVDRAGDRVIASRVVVHQQKAAISKAEAKALREYYGELESSLPDGPQKARAKAQHKYYDELEENLKD